MRIEKSSGNPAPFQCRLAVFDFIGVSGDEASWQPRIDAMCCSLAKAPPTYRVGELNDFAPRPQTVHLRINNHGYTIERAITTPTQQLTESSEEGKTYGH
jgi:hypothetical protein